MAYQVTGNINAQLYEQQWVVSVYDLITGNLDIEQVVNADSFAIPVPDGNPKKVLVEPRRFGVWQAQTGVSINERVYPTDPEATPYYYRCITAGTTGATEPVWQIGDSATVNDGNAVWIMVEGIIQPTCHLPIIPTPV